MQIQKFIFNPFQENCYILWDSTKECIIIDPGCYDENEGCCGSLYQLCGDPRFKVQVTVKGGVLENDCLGIIQEFFQKKRNKK